MSSARRTVTASAWVLLVLGIVAGGGALLPLSASVRFRPLLLLLAAFLVLCAIFLFIAVTRHPSRRTTAGGFGQVATTHTFSFSVGEREKHTIVYLFDQWWGWLTITVDGTMVVEKFITLNFRLRQVFEFTVGVDERHVVRIEKSRPLLVAFARPQPTRAFCDGVLAAEDSGVATGPTGRASGDGS
ncbi:hypothetical protein [Leifsonia sp. Le1]|uniref:hypothetical protein n=1 Tax=Leifsonia sp. Le1 TaxID=3404918 RepID=UPI003EB698FA